MARPAAIPLSAGMTLGRWTLLYQVGGGRVNRSRWYCRCDCGTERPIKPQHLRTGMSRSCGCLKKETAGCQSRTHGASKTQEYRIWAAMMNRCHYATIDAQRGKTYAGYRARNIIVCERWRIFENFLDDMGMRPSRQHSLDRIDNDGNYEPINCRWATAKEQRNNQRRRISTKVKLAATLLALGHVPYEQAKTMTADQIISLYHFDHNILHAIDPIDEPWNLTPMLVAAHREKSRRDTSIVAKVKRLRQAPTVAAGKPKPRSSSSAVVDAKRATDVPRRSWGIPGMRKKLNGEVVRR